MASAPEPRQSSMLALPFDIDAYCARVRYSGPRTVSLATLQGLHIAHGHSVPFENLDIHLGRPPSLEAEDLFTKIVTRRRGGYCYEVNGLFSLVLEALGFRVQGLLARVLHNMPDLRPRAHRLMLVTLEDEAWIADVGFGRHTLRAPLRLVPDVVAQQGPDRFRLRPDGTGTTFALQKWLEEQWCDLYAFTLEPYLPVDYVPLNHWNSTSSESRFTRRKVCALHTPTGCVVAVDTEFTIYMGESSRKFSAKSPSEYIQLLSEYFGLDLDGA